LAPAAQPVAVGANPTSVAVADFNGDGRPDIASVSGGHLTINLNAGGGAFGSPASFATGFSPNGVTAGDFNHDGKADVAVACVFPSSDGVSVLLGNGDGTFVTHPDPFGNPVPFLNYNAGNQTPGYITTGDLDGDGNLDLVTANFSSTGQFGNNSVTLLPGKADGTFGPARVYYGGPAPTGVAVGDFDGDGHPDVVTADAGGSVGTVSLLLGRGDGTLRAAEGLPVTVRNSSWWTGAAAGDFTGDGLADLAVTTWNVGYSGVTLFPNVGNGQFGPGIPSVPIASPSGIAAADVNGDGDLDLVVTGSAGVTILLGNGDGTFTAGTPIPAGSSPQWVVTGDFNGDGKLDLAVANNGGTNGVSILLGDGAGGFAVGTGVAAGGAATHLAAADLNGDGRTDLAVVNSSKVNVVLGNGDGTFGAPTALDAGTASVSVGDFNGDGRPDLAATSFIPPGGGGSAVLVWLNNGAGGFGGMTKYPTDAFGANPIGSAVADLDQDGRLDIVAVNDFSDTVSVFTGTGRGSFNPQVTMVVGDRPTWVATADFTGDGRPDLAVVNSNSGSVTVINTPKPATHVRVDAAPSATAGAAFQVTVTALDEDGRVVPDFIGAVSLGSDDPQGILPGPYAFTLADRGVHTFDVTLETAGSRTVTMTSQFGTLSASVQVDPTDADRLVFDVPTTATAGDLFDVTLTAFDAYGNVATGFRGTVQFATDDPNAAVSMPADYAFTDADAGAHAFPGINLLTAGTRTVSVAADGLPAVAATVDVSPAAASRLTLGAPTTASAGVPFDITVTAFDAYGNLATGFTGTVHFDTTDPIGDLPADYPFTGLDQGAHTSQVTLKRVGAQTVSVSAAGLTGAPSAGIQVTAGTAVKLAFVGQPVNTFPNLAIPAPVTLQVQDEFDNPVSAASPVILSLASNPTNARLKGLLFAYPDANGVVTFPMVKVTKAGTYTLVASSASGVSPASDPFTVYAATHFRVKVTSPVARPTAGDAVTVTVTALDARNRPDPTYRGTVHFTSTDLQAVLPADYTFTAGDNGQHAFDVTLKTAGLKRVAVNDTTKVGVKGRVGVTVVAGAATQFAVTRFPLTARVNRAYAFTVTALDQFGNRATSYLGTVTIASNGSATIGGAGPAAPVPVTYVFKARDGGRHVFAAKFTAPGTGLSLTVTDQANATITGTETGLTVV
jgi:hypothetical protein